MSSSRCCATGVFVLPSLLLLPLFLSLVCGATLREHRLSGAEPVSYGPASQIRPPPSAEMLRALRYIQSLSQRTPPDPLPDEGRPEQDDMEDVRSMLKMAAPARMDRGMEQRENEKDNTEELLQAVLTTLKQTEEHMVPQKTPQKVITAPRYTVPSFARPKQQLEAQPSNYGRNSWGNSDTRRQHRKFPLMFEDEDDQEQPLKRTNENAEEQYTPQKLATLQSVFEELSKITASKANSKRNDDEEEDDEDDDEDNDLYRQRKMILEDIMGTDDWAPLEEQLESEEEERERHQFNRDLEDDDDQEDEEEEDNDEVKRSKQSDWFKTRKEEEPEDMAKLVDYYLLQILEKKEQEQQKRQEAEEEVEKKDVDEGEDDEEEEEEEEEKREIKPMHTFPEYLSQVLKISQKLQIPPEEVLELLQNEKRKDLPGISTQSRISYANPHKTFATAPHRRPIETSDNSVAQDILSILQMVSAAQQYGKQPTQPKTSRYYQRETGRDDYDETAGEDDELANYLASEMLTQGQRRARLTPSQNHDQPMYGNPERIQDYFKKNTQEKRPEHENTDTGIDNNTMMKILHYLDPENDDETDSEGKTVPEM